MSQINAVSMEYGMDPENSNQQSVRFLKPFDAISKAFNWGAEWGTLIFIVLMVVTIGIQVFFRMFNHSLAWSEEVARFLFTWVIFLGATISLKRQDMPSVQVLVNHLPQKGKVFVKYLAEIVILVLGLVLLLKGLSFSTEQIGTEAQTMHLDMFWPTLIMPITGLGIIVHQLYFIMRRLGANSKTWGFLLLAIFIAIAFVLLSDTLPSSMSPYILLGSLLVFFLIGVPVAVVLAVGSVFTLMSMKIAALTVVTERMFSSLDNFILMAVPLFILTGSIMQDGGLAHRLIDFSKSLVGRFRGGLAQVNILSSVFFADISGSAVADTAAIGKVMLPGMVQRGYDKRFATALQAAAGTMGMLFPPSTTTVLYAFVAGVSVGKMFTASILPAILISASFGVVAYITAVRNNYPKEDKQTFHEKLITFRNAIPALIAPIIILGGILTGLVTPTESGVIACLYTILVSVFIYKGFTFKKLRSSLFETVIGTSRVMFIFSSAILLGWVLTVQGIPQELSRLLLTISHNPIILLIILNIFLVLIHTVLETSSTMILVVPLLVPIFESVGVDPIYLGIIIIVNSALGVLTPPIGVLLYVASPITGITLEEISKAIIPFIAVIIIDILLLIAFPQIVHIVPHLLGF